MQQLDVSAMARGIRRVLTLGVGALVAVSTIALGATPKAAADTPPAPATVTADALPTWQVNGVVWSQVVVGNTVYVTGEFSKARPPGVAVGGAGETDAKNIFAFDIRTGNPVPFAHSLNAQGLVIRANESGSRVYVGGDFTEVDGVPRGHIAAFDTATGALITDFNATTDGQVRALAFKGNTVYAGGNFYSAKGQPRTLLAAFDASNGSLTSWAPVGVGGYVWSMVTAPDKSRVIVGGSFTTLNGADAYGMGSLDATTGATLPWAANARLRTAGGYGAISSLSTDGTQIFGSGYSFGTGAKFEGTFAADPTTGAINYVNDCLGDTYDVFPMNGVAYSVSHKHDCSVVGGFPDTSPRSRWIKASAEPTSPVGTINRKDAYGWDFTGLPYSGLLHWYPDLEFGKYTSSRQAAWSVTGNGTYIVLGGEFPIVNGTAQQGLVRFAMRGTAPEAMGPIYNTGFTPTVTSTESGVARVTFNAVWDRDDKELSYDIFRNSGPKIATFTKSSTFWDLPQTGFIDPGLTPGSQVRYQVRARDSKGNYQWSAWSPYVTVSDAPMSPYKTTVSGLGATHLWRLGEPSGAAILIDDLGDAHAKTTGYTLGVAGAVNETDTAATATSSAKITTNNLEDPSAAVTVQAWVKTTSSRGGRIVGFGDSSNATSTAGLTDRALFLDNSGRVNFTVNDGTVRNVVSRFSVNDGQWHQLTGTVGASGLQLFVDGVRVGRDQRFTTAGVTPGFWRIGADNTTGFTNRPSDSGLVGTIDEVAVFPKELSIADVQAGFVTSGRSASWPTAPADTYGVAVKGDNPDIYWRMDGTSTTVVDASGNGNTGTLTDGLQQYSQGGALGDNAAMGFDGAKNVVVAAQPWNSPSAYSVETWFKSTSTRGGKLLGFGNATSGLSGTYDRHVYMLNNGRLSFGVSSGGQQILTTPTAYNDGQWHHVVATQGADGMRMYVDGLLAGSNDVASAAAYQGYWRAGGDRVWSGASSSYFSGTLDEVAVYPTVLTEDQVRAHFTASGRVAPNRPPVASFTSSTHYLDVAVDGSASSDADGPVVSYAWSFGDGTTATGATASHTYAAPGTYTVSLTVTDGSGATTVKSESVTVAPNKAPTASFSTVKNLLDVTFDGRGSVDSDGSVVTYAWDFGDGTTGTGDLAAHSYATAGDYTVTLTVTDDAGATNTVSKSVSLLANQAPTASFSATESMLDVTVDGSASSDPDGNVETYNWNFGDGTTGTGANASHSYAAAGTYTVTLVVIDNHGLASSAVTKSVSAVEPPNQAPTAGFSTDVTDLTVGVDASGSGDIDGTVSTYAWDFGDGATGSGKTASHTYTTAGDHTITLTVTDDDGATGTTTRTVTTTVPNQAPQASFTTDATFLALSVDASASSDADGTIAGYAWDFGDGSTGSGATASHTYASPGTYTVKVTVTDDDGAKTTKTKDVTVVREPGLAEDAFGDSSTGGWGSADRGGAWTITTGASKFAVTGGVGKVTMAAGAGYTASLAQVSTSSADVRVSFSSDVAPTGGGQYVSIVGRQVSGAGDYRAKVRMLATGAVSVQLSKMVGTTETALSSQTVSGLTYSAGDTLQVRLQVTGTNGTDLKVKVWKAGTQEPAAWTTTATDSTAALQVAGAVAVSPYISGSTTNGPVTVSFDDLDVRAVA